jgi:hypothetical protein
MIYKTGLLALFLNIASVAGRGFVKSVTVGTTTYAGFDPRANLPDRSAVVGWTTSASDLGFIQPNNAGTPDIICHKNGTAAQAYVDVKAGDTLTIEWSSWPNPHKGPIIDYLAACFGNCSSVDKTSLRFFKIAATALIKQNNAFGYWGTDQLIDNKNKWQVTIPREILPGNYVLRHEIISLLQAFSINGAGLYPQCINLRISGPGVSIPVGVPGTSLYKASDPGLLFGLNFYVNPYPIPGSPLAIV